MRVFFICLLTLATFSSLHAAEYTQATDIIQAEGEFVTTDGSSYFSFRKDGTFSSGPLSMSGRQIEG
ncbi:MAG TPA: hypothetical protein DF383_01535, partial [Deltaproteobacteria bacterium]|nr:hypothetical protein [Deltaproteobacteria bacterium]